MTTEQKIRFKIIILNKEFKRIKKIKSNCDLNKFLQGMSLIKLESKISILKEILQ